MDAAGGLAPLSFLETGDRARVECVLGSASDVQRLEELGFRAGTEVEMILPGSPCIVRLGQTKFCLRDADVFQVVVTRHAGLH